MLTLAILGFLAERPMHAYELKKHIAGLAGHVRRVSDGALYPAVSRLEESGWLTRREEPGQSVAPRQMITLTEAGREELLRRLRNPGPQDITDRSKFRRRSVVPVASARPAGPDRRPAPALGLPLRARQFLLRRKQADAGQ